MPSARARSEIAWGGIDQGLSSATNLGLSILAGRLLGAAGVGIIFIGFSAYLLALNLARGIITSPAVVATAALDQEQRNAATRRCMTLVVAAGAGMSALMFLIGLAAPDPVGPGLRIFAPWILVALVQDHWRSVLFRDQRGSAAALNDAVWVVGMLAMVPFAWSHLSEWSVVATWGAGAALSAIFGWFQVRLRPTRFAEAARWWNRELRRLGSWLAIESILIAAGSQAFVIMLATILDASDLGGIRVVDVLFAPMSLINEAFTFPGIPIMTRALATSIAEAKRWAWRLGLGAMALVCVYLAVIAPFAGTLLSHVFGPEFKRFTNLVVPTALGQIPAGLTLGFLILLKADRRGHAIVMSMIVRIAVTMPIAGLFAVWFGVVGAVWGVALGSAVAAAATISLGLLNTDIQFRGGRELVREQS